VTSKRSGRSSRYGDDDDDDDINNPHDKVIGKTFLKGMHRNKTYIEKLTVTDFRNIDFDYDGFPKFAIDFFEYMTLFKIDKY
jgi:hypothetical protein